MVRYFWMLVAVLALTPAAAFAAGGHDMLGCTGCHSIHDVKGAIIFGVEPNKTVLNPKDNKPYTGTTALCLACHEVTGGMGIKPVTGKKSHPYGVAPNTKVAGVPQALLRDGKLECVGCHDPHPSNPNHRYLRVDTQKGGKMQNFCSLCHASKSGITIKPSEIFDSMDERNTVSGEPTKAKAK